MNGEKFYQRTWFIILLLIFFFPVGLFLMWKYSDWNKIVKIIITVLLVIFFIGYMVSPDEDDKPSAPQSNISDSQEDDQDEPGNDEAVKDEKVVQPEDTRTLGQKSALDKAEDYLDYSAFSYSGLIEQLEFEGFSIEEATYAVDNCGADWSEQAALKAQSYLDYSSFSRSGLIEQLEFEGFSTEQAEYGAAAVGY